MGGPRCSPCSDSNASSSFFVNTEEEHSQLGASFREREREKKQNTKTHEKCWLKTTPRHGFKCSEVLGQFRIYMWTGPVQGLSGDLFSEIFKNAFRPR